LKKLLTNGTESDLTHMNEGHGFPFPPDLDVTMLGVRTEKVKVFTSANAPLLLPIYYKKKNEVVQ